jgi:indole-3-glycerol phosphate synthase
MAARRTPEATYLSGIVAAHREAAARDQRDPEALESQAQAMPGTRGFKEALLQPSETGEQLTKVIAEIKRRSPSKGDMALDLNPGRLAQAYEAGGGSCLSVLTDEQFFGGSVEDLRAARAACSLPVLRKDFTVARNDVADARSMGADAILLIVAALSEEELGDLLEMAARLCLDALVEVHDHEELEVALSCGANLVGVNQRNLSTFEVDTDLACSMAASIPSHVVAVAESGVKVPEQVERIAAAGFQAVLVGESLVTADDPRATLQPFTHYRTGSRGSLRAMASG